MPYPIHEELYETKDYVVTLNPPEERIEYNYTITNKHNGCTEAEMKALPNAVEAALVLQSKWDAFLDEEEQEEEVAQVISLVRDHDPIH